MMIDIEKKYEKKVTFLSEDGDIMCKVKNSAVHLNTKEMGFEIKIKLSRLPSFLRTLKKVKKFFKEECGNELGTRVAMYSSRNESNYFCECSKEFGRMLFKTNIPVPYELYGPNPECPWIEPATCNELIDFIETNFIFGYEANACYKEMFSIIKRIKELK